MLHDVWAQRWSKFAIFHLELHDVFVFWITLTAAVVLQGQFFNSSCQKCQKQFADQHHQALFFTASNRCWVHPRSSWLLCIIIFCTLHTWEGKAIFSRLSWKRSFSCHVEKRGNALSSAHFCKGIPWKNFKWLQFYPPFWSLMASLSHQGQVFDCSLYIRACWSEPIFFRSEISRT